MHLFTEHTTNLPHTMATPFTYPYQTHHIALPGNCNIAYIDEGKGNKTLLFIHGLANYALVWKKNIDYLKQFYRCIAIDLPGNGLSDQNAHPFTMKFFADTVNDFIGEMGLKNVQLIGHSMGGQIAITTALHHPGCAESLVLCAPAGFEVFSALEKTMYFSTMHLFDFFTNDEHILTQTIESSFYKSPQQGKTVIDDLKQLMRTYKSAYYHKMIEACIKSMVEDTVFNDLQKIQQPTLIIFGNKDALIPNKLIHHTTTEALATSGAKKIPNASLVLIPDCGHFVQWEKDEDVNKNIIVFLEEKK